MSTPDLVLSGTVSENNNEWLQLEPPDGGPHHLQIKKEAIPPDDGNGQPTDLPVGALAHVRVKGSASITIIHDHKKGQGAAPLLEGPTNRYAEEISMDTVSVLTAVKPAPPTSDSVCPKG